MKITVNVECSPEEARKFMGLPDVTDVNKVYIDALTQAMQGSGFEQMNDIVRRVAPMGEFGLKMFRQLMDSGASMAMGAGSTRRDEP